MTSPAVPELAAIVARWDLLRHPFYQAWNAGTLPLPTLATYAAEYGEFIRTIPAAWRSLGEEGIARIEDGHGELWAAFAESLGTPVRVPTVPAVATLCQALRDAAPDPAQALGALYPFEAQQAAVARSKLDGLERHYRRDQPELAVGYFAAHLDDYEEPALLEARYLTWGAESRSRALGAADRIGAALWGALDGILATTPPPRAG